ncbi:MAG: DUF2117 domain-containing protein [Methanoregulaceae archaeon]|nr:DUF2117 domain-containing protein [Methanoregulaceae archaeon]
MRETQTGTEELVMVVHGPEAFDSGDAARMIAAVHPERVVVAGVMGRTAAEESGIRCEYAGLPPSRVIPGIEGRIFMLNRGKTAESGRIFGGIVASRLGEPGLLHVECSNGCIYCWNRESDDLSDYLASATGYPVLQVRTGEVTNTNVREIRGCIPGEAVFVDGIVIGRARDTKVVLTQENGRIVPLSGLIPKIHGLEKIHRRGCLDVTKAWCKSGPVRRADPVTITQRRDEGLVVYIDHCGHELYSRVDDRTCGVVSVGDDTTAVCGHIGAHLGLPVLGVVDGDGDDVVGPRFAPGSVILHVLEGRDDDLGLEIRDKISDSPVKWMEFVKDIISFLGPRVRVEIPGHPD